MATIIGTPGNDTLTGTAEDDQIAGGGGNDTISGLAGNDTIYGDTGEGAAAGQDATPLVLSWGNIRPGTETSPVANSADPGDTIIYDNVATLADGSSVSARLVLVSVSSNRLEVDLSGGTGYEILLNGTNESGRAGETATFRLEFLDPVTLEPIAINSTATFNDLDRNSAGDQESVTVDAASFSAYGTSADTSLNVTTGAGTVNAAGTEANDPSDQDAWFSAEFHDRSFIEFTLETRSSQSGFTLSGDLIDDSVVVPIPGGNDVLYGGAGNDTIYGQGGNDQLYGGAGEDTLYAGDGSDQVYGGAGADEIHGGGDNDTLSGGDDADTIFVDTLGSAGVNNTTVDGGSGGDDNDTLDLSGLVAEGFTITNMVKNPENNGQPGYNGQVTLTNATTGEVANINFTDIERIVCFTPGTAVATPTGERRVEELKPGDRVFTRDNGAQEIRWIGTKTLSPAELSRQRSLAPVLIRRGALGNGLPERDMLVSPSHRMLITSDQAQLYFEEREVLVAAKHLLGRTGVERILPKGPVSYVHFMCDHHEVVLADGAWSESFQPGDHSLAGLAAAQRAELFALFPELAEMGKPLAFTAARRSLKRHEARLLIG